MCALTLGESIRAAVAMLEGDLSMDAVGAVMLNHEWTSTDAMQLVAGFALVSQRMTSAAGIERATIAFADMRALGDCADQSVPWRTRLVGFDGNPRQGPVEPRGQRPVGRPDQVHQRGHEQAGA